jgi:hypothetical protein
MGSERLSGAVIPGLVACLSIGVLLLAVEMSQVLGTADMLSLFTSASVAGAALLLYAALAWRATTGEGPKRFVGWWGALIVAHALLGTVTGAASAALQSSALAPDDMARWAGGASLPMAVLQVGYSVGVVALVWGREPSTTEGSAATRGAPPETGAAAAAGEMTAHANSLLCTTGPRLEVYAQAIERVRAGDVQGLLTFAVQAGQCAEGFLATHDGRLIAAVGGTALEPSSAAAALPGLLSRAKVLAPSSRGPAALISVASGGTELLVAAGQSLVGCLVGPKPGARDVAEAVLSATVARAERQWARPPGCSPTQPAARPHTVGEERL